MSRYILTRTFYSLITLWLLVTIVFGMVRLTGDPVKMYGEVGADKAYLDQLRHRWGLDKPLYRQYLSFMGNLLQGDFGYSFAKSLKVRDIYLQRLPNSLKLGIGGFIISLVLGIPLGMLSAVQVNTWWDNVGKVFALLGLSLPSFFVGLVLLLLFGVELGWLPIIGKGDHWWDWQHLILPAFSLGWYFSGAMVRITRSGMLDVLGSEYIKLARLKGVPERVVMARHAFKNAMIPVLTLAGLNLVIMVNVAVVIEVVFSWPGVGQLLYDGMTNRDFPMVQGVVLMGGVMIVVVNFIIDVVYAYVDPRIRLSR
ncbi:MAG: ABC transporter permease [Candidatus Entotheonellia bacterium]